MSIALDTNILVYAQGVNGAEKRASASAIIDRLPTDATVIPAQVLGEFFDVLVRKAARSPAEARVILVKWQDTFRVAETTPATLAAACDLAVDHQFRVWDAVILAVASRAGCRLLLSEDLHHGFTWGGVTVVNPFAMPPHPLLDILLSDAP